MSCCGGKCSCGSNCGCGSGCKGCNKDLDVQFGEKSVGSPILHLTNSGNSDMGFMDGIIVGGENGGCKCGSNCTCNPCNCK